MDGWGLGFTHQAAVSIMHRHRLNDLGFRFQHYDLLCLRVLAGDAGFSKNVLGFRV